MLLLHGGMIESANISLQQVKVKKDSLAPCVFVIS